MGFSVANRREAAERRSRALVCAVNCYHCGLPVPAGSAWSATVEGVAQPMCCAGCAAVAQTIVNNGLTSYYRERQSFPERDNAVPQALRDLTVFDNAENGFGDVQAPGSHLPPTATPSTVALQALPAGTGSPQ